MINFIKSLFKPQKSFKVRLLRPTGVRIHKASNTDLYNHKPHDYVYTNKEMVLQLVKSNIGYYFFRVHNPFVCRKLEAPNHSVVYISKYEYKKLEKRIL